MWAETNASRVITAMCFVVGRLAVTAAAAAIGIMLGLAVDRIATLPQLERFWIGVAWLGAFVLAVLMLPVYLWLRDRS